MRRLAAALALALVAAGCTRGGSPELEPTRTPGRADGYLAFAGNIGVFVTHGELPRRLATPGKVLDLAVSEDGRYVAYVVDAPRLTVGLHDVVDGRTRTWTAPDDALTARTLGVASNAFVAVGEDSDRMLRFDPEAMVEGGEPEHVTLRGVTAARLVAVRDDRVVVATGRLDSPRGGPETLYDVARDGATTRLFTDGEGVRGAQRTIAVGYAGLSADGTTLVYGTGRAGADCDLDLTVAVRDLTAGREVATRPPTLGAGVVTAVSSVTVDADGRLVVGFSTDLGGCAQREAAASYALSGTTWTQVANGARWAAKGTDGRLAVLTPAGALAVGGRRIASGVTHAAWSPV